MPRNQEYWKKHQKIGTEIRYFTEILNNADEKKFYKMIYDNTGEMPAGIFSFESSKSQCELIIYCNNE